MHHLPISLMPRMQPIGRPICNHDLFYVILRKALFITNNVLHFGETTVNDKNNYQNKIMLIKTEDISVGPLRFICSVLSKHFIHQLLSKCI